MLLTIQLRSGMLIALALAIAACAATPPAVAPTPTPTREPGALNVTALLDLSGSRAPSGAPQREALQLWADQHATSSPRVRLRIVDVAGSPAKTILELRRAAVEERADAVVIGVPVDYNDAFADAVQLAKIPVVFTLPIPDPVMGGGGWAFGLAPTPEELARATLDQAGARVAASVNVVVSDESGTAVPERSALVAEMTTRRIQWSLMKVTATDAAQRVRGLLPVPQITLYFVGQPKPYLDAVRAASPASLVYLSYLTEAGDLSELRDAASFVTWPGSRWVAATASGATAARTAFIQAYTDRAGPPPTYAASAYDALGLLAAAADRGVDPERLRERLQARAFVGVATTYTFGASWRAGFAPTDIAFLRHVGGRAAPVVR